MKAEESSQPKFVTRAAYAFAVATVAVLITVSSASSKSAKRKPEALWVGNADFVAEFADATLETTGTPTPNRINTSADFDAPGGIIFDSSKDLWVSNIQNGTLTEFTFAQLKALDSDQAPAANVVISGLEFPEGMAFDRHHHLWVANDGTPGFLPPSSSNQPVRRSRRSP